MKILTTFKPSKEVIAEMVKLGACVTVFASEEELIKSNEVEEADAVIAN